jgi:hypothetical protein
MIVNACSGCKISRRDLASVTLTNFNIYPRKQLLELLKSPGVFEAFRSRLGVRRSV